MRSLGIALGVLACVTALIAARLWYRSSQVQIDPGWGPPGSGLGFEPLDQSGKAIGWAVATIQAFNEVSRLNKWAAIWTAGAAILTAAAGVASIFAS